MVIRAVGRLYRSQPGVKRFTMKLRGGKFIPLGYKWYREPWMDEMLNAYRVMLETKKRRRADDRAKPTTKEKP